jgi:hypothetical protein
MRFLLCLCAIGLFTSSLGLFEQLGRYFHAQVSEEIATGLYAVIEDPTERRLRDWIPDEKSAEFAKSVLAHNREISQQMIGMTSKIGSDLQDRALWDAALWGIQVLVLAIVFARLNAVRRGKRSLGA